MKSFIRNKLAIAAILLSLPAGCDAEPESQEDADLGFRGETLYNGLELGNGLMFSNGLKLLNGLQLSNGLAQNGLQLSNGLLYSNGLSPSSGYMSTADGRKFVKYLVECALAEGDSITKNGYTFQGRVGVAPEWKYGSCGENCQEWVSACLLARTNEFGKSVQIDMRADHRAIGIDAGNYQFSEQEGAFFGNLFANPPRAYACMGSNWGNGIWANRTCTSTSGACGIRTVDYLNCFWECDQVNGTFSNCRTTMLNTWGSGKSSYSAVITTYLKPYWMN